MGLGLGGGELLLGFIGEMVLKLLVTFIVLARHFFELFPTAGILRLY
jgi:hypothetical protein